MHCQFQGQHGVQPCFIELNGHKVCADYDSNIGGGTPEKVWNGEIRRYSIPCLLASVANDTMEHLEPLFQRVADGLEYDSYSGASLNNDAQDAEDEIDRELGCGDEHHAFNHDDTVQAWDCDEWFVDDFPRDLLTKLAKDRKGLEDDLQEECADNCGGFLENLDWYLDQIEAEAKDPESVSYARIESA